MTDRSSRPCSICFAKEGQSHDPTCYWHDSLRDTADPPPLTIYVFFTWHGHVRLWTADKARADEYAALTTLTPTVYRIDIT